MLLQMKRALLIGCNYVGTCNQLAGCVSDATHIQAILVGQGYRDLVLLDDNTTFKPNLKSIEAGIAWLLSSQPASAFDGNKKDYFGTVIPNSSLIFTYSGHGTQVPDKTGNEPDGLSEAICPVDFDDSGFITDVYLKANLADKVPATVRLTAVLDSCHSQSAMNLAHELKYGLFGECKLSTDGKQKETVGDVICLSGCKDSGTSADTSYQGVPCGALTTSMINVLKESGYKMPSDALLTGVRRFLKEKQVSSQIPCLSFGRNEPTTDVFTL